MEEKSFGKKFLIITLTILAFFVLLYVLESISKPSLMLYNKIKSNIVVAQIKNAFTDEEKEQVDWNYPKNDIYLLESGIGISESRRIYSKKDDNISGDANTNVFLFNSYVPDIKYAGGKGYSITSPAATTGLSYTVYISVLNNNVYSKTTYYGFSRVLFPVIVLFILLIPIFVALIKLSVTYFIRSEKDKFIIIRLIVYCILYVIIQTIMINLNSNLHILCTFGFN